MANTLTALAPTLYAAAREISRELVGVVAAANTDFDDKGAALNDTVKVPRVAAASNSDYTPAMTTTAGTDLTPTTDDLTISKSRHNSWHLKHEERRSLDLAGNFAEFMRLRTQEGIRALVNQIELEAWQAAYQASSRGYGTAGTTPFASNLSEAAQVRKILDDNGCPSGMRSLVIDTTAGANYRSLGQVTKANEAGGDDLLRNGNLGQLLGMALRESGQITTHTKGTGASYQLSAAGAVGDTAINVDTGSGTILAGDVITVAGTSHKYIVNTALSGGVFSIGRPGLRAAEADNDAITVGNNYTPNVALHKNALAIAVRPPIIEPAPNMNVMPITDPVSGLTVLMVEIIGDGMTTYRVHLVWGIKVISPEHIATLLG